MFVVWNLLNCPSPPRFYQIWKETEEELEEDVSSGLSSVCKDGQY